MHSVAITTKHRNGKDITTVWTNKHFIDLTVLVGPVSSLANHNMNLWNSYYHIKIKVPETIEMFYQLVYRKWNNSIFKKSHNFTLHLGFLGIQKKVSSPKLQKKEKENNSFMWMILVVLIQVLNSVELFLLIVVHKTINTNKKCVHSSQGWTMNTVHGIITLCMLLLHCAWYYYTVHGINKPCKLDAELNG